MRLPLLVTALLVLIALVTGTVLMPLLAGLGLLFLHLRQGDQGKRRRAIEALLRTVGASPSRIVFRPGHTRLVAEDVWPKDKQWALIRSIPDLVVVRNRPGAPGHKPPEEVGCLVDLTDEGRRAFRQAVAAARRVPQARLSAY